MGLNAAVQALKKAEKVKEKVLNSRDLLNNGEAWIWQQQLQRSYQQVLLLDLEYALDRKVEQDLWNYGFKNYISILQNAVKDRKNQKRNESQAMLTWCLESASGFYLTLLQEICSAFDLDLSFRRKDSVYGSNNCYVGSDRLIQPQKTSCSYICQHCLVHLGDLARYRNQNRQAESFYRHAVQLSPTSGQPYNQLALLDSSRGDRLGTIFHYVRSVAVRHLFPAAATNLSRMFSKCAEEQLNLEGRNKLSVQECVALFLKLHGMLHSTVDVTACQRAIRLFTDTLTAQVATESFTSRKLVQMLAINLYALHHSRGSYSLHEIEKDKELSGASPSKLLVGKMQVKELVLDIIAGSLCALLLPVYTLREGDCLLEYFALPAIKLTLDWIKLEPEVLSDQAFKSRLQIWPSLCKLLNGLQPLVKLKTVSTLPLPEDQELQGFLPLERAFTSLRFSYEDDTMEAAEMNQSRAARIVEFGKWLSERDDSPITFSKEIQEEGDETNDTRVFKAVASGQMPSSELIRELEQLSLGLSFCPQPSPSPSDSESWAGSSTSTPGGAVSPNLQQPVILESVQVPEKRAGILKPQGSLEKAREKDESGGLQKSGGSRKIGRQNVAMQAILRKGVSQENDVKQVSFKTPSPIPASPPEKLSNQWTHTWTPSKLEALQAQYHQPQPVSQHPIQPPQQQLPYTQQSQQTPPLQQLQHQAQSRVAHLPPFSPLPSLPRPTPSIPYQNLNTVQDARQQLRQPYLPWSQEPQNSGQTWWPPAPVDPARPIRPNAWTTNQQQNVNRNSGMQAERPYQPQGSGLVQGFSPYSLFSSNTTWMAPTISPNNSGFLASDQIDAEWNDSNNTNYNPATGGAQSLWSGPGPSPLERLLEQQKQLRENPGPVPKSGT